MAEQDWVDDPELDAALLFLGMAVVGQPDERGGRPIDASGVGSNCAAAFRNEVFAIRDYCWCEGGLHPEAVEWDSEDSPYAQMPPSGGTSSGCPMNFEHFGSGIKGTWYKRLGRDGRYSREAAPGEALDVLLDCLISIGYRRGHKWPAAGVDSTR